MSDSTNKGVFPSDKFEALTMLYIQNQDLSDMTPEQLYDEYEKVLNAITQHDKEIHHRNKQTVNC